MKDFEVISQFGKAKDKRIALRISNDMLSDVKKLSNDLGLSFSTIVRSALHYFIKNQ